jgi:hypothetical protein
MVGSPTFIKGGLSGKARIEYGYAQDKRKEKWYGCFSLGKPGHWLGSGWVCYFLFFKISLSVYHQVADLNGTNGNPCG